MRISALIDNTGNFLNPAEQNQFINQSPINGNAGFSLFLNQLTVEFFDEVTEQANGLKIYNPASKVVSGLSGTLQIKVWASANSPYPVDLSSDTIDISDSCIIQWTGITYALEVICTDIEGAEYINLLLDRN